MFKKASLLLSIAALFTISFSPAKAQFIDTENDSINHLHQHGVIKGYQDGTFKPQNQINRAELIKMIIEATNTEVIPTIVSCFPDVPANQWFTDYICTAQKKGWITGYSDGTFKPSQNVNTAEALKIIAEIQEWILEEQPWEVINHEGIRTKNETSPYSDVPTNAWFYPYVLTAYNRGFINHTPNLSPSSPINREQVAEILFRSIIDNQLLNCPLANHLSTCTKDFFTIENSAKKVRLSDFGEKNIVAKDSKKFGIYQINLPERSELEVSSINVGYATHPYRILLVAEFFQNNETPIRYKWIASRETQKVDIQYLLEGLRDDVLDIAIRTIWSETNSTTDAHHIIDLNSFDLILCQRETPTDSRCEKPKVMSSANSALQKALDEGAQIKELRAYQIKNLPEDIYEAQIYRTFEVNKEILLATVYQQNLSSPVVIAGDPTINWKGILISTDSGKSWKKWYQTKDVFDSDGQPSRYNPNYIFNDGNILYIDMLNDAGAGSGEGNLQRLSSKDGGFNWRQEKCFYYTPEAFFTVEDGNYVEPIKPWELQEETEGAHIFCLYK